MSFVPNLPKLPTKKFNALNEGFKDSLSFAKDFALLAKKVFML